MFNDAAGFKKIYLATGYTVGRRKARRYMNEMGINPIYPKMNPNLVY